ncbi:hypothetical protein HN51_004120 [Arachis hypogaea]
MYAPRISDELRQKVMSMLYVGISLNNIIQHHVEENDECTVKIWVQRHQKHVFYYQDNSGSQLESDEPDVGDRRGVDRSGEAEKV